ncbi:MAG: hypothetical protein RL348_943 [Bacteroidota bacterium]|jgi:hypothetical protein
MSNNKQQTAVEWLYFEINRRGPKENNPPQWLIELYEQAKEMEKEQIMDAFNNGENKSAQLYYNETYGGKK